VNLPYSILVRVFFLADYAGLFCDESLHAEDCLMQGVWAIFMVILFTREGRLI
jgi:hypothetical protein